jgi:hypothetical protein
VDIYTYAMLANSQTAGCEITPFASDSPWRPITTPIVQRAAMSENLAMKDTLIASAFLCAYIAFYMVVGFAGLSALEWAWTYLTN